MRPFNLDRVNTVKNPERLSGKTELTPFEKEIQPILIQPQGLCTNKMVTHAGTWTAVSTEEGKVTGVNPTFIMQTTFSLSKHRVCSHSYCKPMSTTMPDLITSQVHSMHAITVEATEKKAAKQQKQG